jgi:hydroxymethylglutaryl-CoA lyase
MADPKQVHRTLRSLQTAFPDLRIGVHLHTRSGRALANTLAAMLAGTAWVETAFGGLGGDLWFPSEPDVLGNTPTEDVLAMCDAMGVATGIDQELYRRVMNLAEEATGRPSIAHVVRGGTRTEMSHVDWDALFTRPGRAVGIT